ncbi:hypothetical protein GN304_02790 [Bombella sp. ESL0368]|nr:hypothetical protein GN304_02790 [Bombella sp. ESL0368]
MNRFFLKTINSPKQAFACLGDIYKFFLSCPYNEVILDFSRVRWIESHFSALLFAIEILCNDNDKKIVYDELTSNVRDVFERIGLLRSDSSCERNVRNIIPLKFFNVEDENSSREFAKYTEINFCRILSISEVSVVLENIRDEILDGMNELFSNAELHAKAERGIVTAGQFFPKKKKFDFVIVDLGIGFQECIQNSKRIDDPSFSITPSAAIEWGFQDGNTTRRGDIPGGLGLKSLKSFIVKNRGALSVFSHGGFWSYTKGTTEKVEMECNLPLTVIVVEVKTDKI